MRLDIHHHIELPAEVLDRLDDLSRKADLIIKNQETIMSALDDELTKAEAAAKANSDADDAVEALLITLSTQIANLKTTGTDPATITRIQALSTALAAKASTLAAAVVANTPAAAPPAGP